MDYNSKLIKNRLSNINGADGKIQKYLTLLIIGYFMVKIIYGIFDKYTKKPQRDEMVDFTMVIVLGMVLYVLTNFENRNVFTWFFLIGYIFGLNFPFFFQTASNNNDLSGNTAIQYLAFGVFILILFIMVYLSISSSSAGANTLYYVLYLVVIVLIIFGIIITRKKPRTFSATKMDENLQNILDKLSGYFDTDKLVQMIDSSDFRKAVATAVRTNDTTNLIPIINEYVDYNSVPANDKRQVLNLILSLNRPIIETGYLNVHGTYVSFGVALIGWLLSLLFMYDSNEPLVQNFLTLFNGFTIGLFVGGVSFFGLNYILADQAEKQCFGSECDRANMVFKNEEYTNVAAGLATVKWGLAFVVIIMIILVIGFFIQNNF